MLNVISSCDTAVMTGLTEILATQSPSKPLVVESIDVKQTNAKNLHCRNFAVMLSGYNVVPDSLNISVR